MTLCKPWEMKPVLVPPFGPSSDTVILDRIGGEGSTAPPGTPPGLEETQEKQGFQDSPQGTSPSSSLRPSSEYTSFRKPSSTPSAVSPGLLWFPPLARVPSVSLPGWCGMVHSLLAQAESSFLIHLCGQGLVHRAVARPCKEAGWVNR